MRQKGAFMTKSNKTTTRLKRLLILAGILILLIFLLRVYGHKDQELTGVPDAVGSTVSGGTCSLTVTANAERISDREAFMRILYEPADTDADISIQDDPEKYILTIE